MTTAADLVQRVRDLVYGGATDEFNRLGSAHTAGEQSLVFDFDPRGATTGSVLSIGLSTYLVWTVDAISKSVEVSPGHAGSVESGHPAKSLVRVRPRVTDKVIFDALNRDLRLMSSPEQGLYAVGTWNPVVDPVDQAWVVPAEHAGMERILACRFTPTGQPDRWLEANAILNTSDDEQRVVMTTYLSPSDTVEIAYAKPFGQFTSLDDPVEPVGLVPDLEDIPVFGAAASVLWGMESRRNQLVAQSDTRRPDEVPAGALTGTAREFARQRTILVNAELARLQRRYPYRRTLSGGY
jgi:hypothetical protein